MSFCIREIYIESFGKFKSKRISFKNGLNVVYGENESGKSTIHSFIYGMFYGFVKPTNSNRISYTLEHERYNPWESDNYRGVIFFRYNGNSYSLERNFTKYQESVNIYDMDTGEDITQKLGIDDGKRVLQPGLYFFGVDSRTFENTIFSSQMGLHNDLDKALELKERLVNMSNSGEEKISPNIAIEKLKELSRQIGSNRFNKSEYNITNNKLQIIIKDISEIQETEGNYEKTDEAINDLRARKNKLKEQLEISEAIEFTKLSIEKNEHAKKLRDYKKRILENKPLVFLEDEAIIRLEELSDELRNYEFKEKVNLTERLKIKEKIDFEEFNPIDLEVSEKKLELIEDLILERRNLLDIESLENSLERLNKRSKLFTVLIIAAVAITLFSISRFNNSSGINIYAVSSVILFLAVIALYIKNKKGIYNILQDVDKWYKYQNKASEEEIADVFEEKKRLEDDIERIRFKIDKKQSLIKDLSDNYALEQRLEIDSSKLKTDIISIIGKHEAINYRFLNDIANSNIKYKALCVEVEQIEEIIDRITSQISKIQTKRLIDLTLFSDEKIEELLTNRTYFESELSSLNIDISNLKQKNEQLEKLILRKPYCIEEKEKLEKELKTIEYKLSSINIAIEKLEKAQMDMHKMLAPEINDSLSIAISKLTNQKYQRAFIDKELNISIETINKGKIVSIDALSGGTIDQIYMGFRLEMAKRILGDNSPIFLDEAFKQFDDKRLEKGLEYLNSIANTRQVILFTCHTREKEALNKKGYEFHYNEL